MAQQPPLLEPELSHLMHDALLGVRPLRHALLQCSDCLQVPAARRSFPLPLHLIFQWWQDRHAMHVVYIATGCQSAPGACRPSCTLAPRRPWGRPCAPRWRGSGRARRPPAPSPAAAAAACAAASSPASPACSCWQRCHFDRAPCCKACWQQDLLPENRRCQRAC